MRLLVLLISVLGTNAAFAHADPVPHIHYLGMVGFVVALAISAMFVFRAFIKSKRS